jgi:hypothetical protein
MGAGACAKHPLGVVLRRHQHMREASRQPRQIDLQELENRISQTRRGQIIRDRAGIQLLQRPRVDRENARVSSESRTRRSTTVQLTPDSARSPASRSPAGPAPTITTRVSQSMRFPPGGPATHRGQHACPDNRKVSPADQVGKRADAHSPAPHHGQTPASRIASDCTVPSACTCCATRRAQTRPGPRGRGPGRELLLPAWESRHPYRHHVPGREVAAWSRLRLNCGRTRGGLC